MGIYVNLSHNSGTLIHQGHPRTFEQSDAAFPTRLLTADEKDTAKAMVESSFVNGTGRNFLHARMGRFLERMKISYLSRRSDDKPDNITPMLDSFRESDEVKYTILSDISAADLVLF